MSANASKLTCSSCDGTGWKIVEKNGMSGATPCECRGKASWWRFRKYSERRANGDWIRKHDRWIYCAMNTPNSLEVKEFAKSIIGLRVDVEKLGPDRPTVIGAAPFRTVRSIDLFMEKL